VARAAPQREFRAGAIEMVKEARRAIQSMLITMFHVVDSISSW
jgi:hypothetical protein